MLTVRWLYKADASFKVPYEDDLSALLHEPTFRNGVPEAVFNKALLISRIGNRALHDRRPIPGTASITAVEELFHVAYWLAHTYGRAAPDPDVGFDSSRIPSASPTLPPSTEEMQQLESALSERDEELTTLLLDGAGLDDELIRLRAEVAKAKAEASERPDPHDYSEAETRDRFIDLLLHEAGWPLSDERDREYEVSGMPNARDRGFVDYVLWGDDGRPLGLVEAKRTKKSPKLGKRQAELYADCLEREFGQRPVIFYSNGYDHWIWDDAMYPPRSVQGFYTKDELALLIQRRTGRRSLMSEPVKEAIAERYYQTRAIRRICEALEQDLDRKVLLVMATGAGKTRTAIALSELLMRCNWVKRVLFLADRIALVNQAVGAFKTHMPESSPVNLISERHGEGRVYVCTYPTMMGLVNEMEGGRRRFGPGYFDLIVIDEAHRSIYQKYRAIFDYFDGLLMGLTATPKDEIDINTYHLFDLERGVPTDSYGLDEAVKDGFLVPPVAVSVPIKFPRQGIAYRDLSSQEREQWDALEWDDSGVVPDRVEAAALNAWLFNEDTVDKVLEHLMTRGIRVAGGDRIGKTIIFARNQAHAEFIVERFDRNYPRFKGSMARAIYHGVSYAHTLIDDFSTPGKPPHVAVSVDMLDTGIDIPDVVNLVFFKQVRSVTKFWQMIGRGTRLRPDLLGPGKDKVNFYVLDYCQNLEFFSQDFVTTEGRLRDALSKRLFTTRLDLIAELDQQTAAAGQSDTAGLRSETASLLHDVVSSMDTNNFVVRPERALVERYAKAEAWTTLGKDDLHELAAHLAGLPSDVESEDEEAKRFDLLVLNVQLAVLRHELRLAKLQDQVIEIAGLLEEQEAIPMVKEQLVLLEELQSDEWWQDVTVAMLEQVRKKLRLLVRFIERHRRQVLYADFQDEMGDEREVVLLDVVPQQSMERFRAKALAFLRDLEDHMTIHKLRMNMPLTAMDLDELEAMMVRYGIGDAEMIAKAKEENQGLGLFVRSLVGLDRTAAKQAFANFLDGSTHTTNQIEFVNMIVDHLTEHGLMETARLYESPFTDIAPHGPDDLFVSDEVDALVAVLDQVRAAAVAA